MLLSEKIHTVIVCGGGATGKTQAVNDVLRSSSGGIFLWNYGEPPQLRPALLMMVDSDNDNDDNDNDNIDRPHKNLHGMVVLRLAVDDLTRALQQEFGNRCAVAVFEPSLPATPT